MTDNGLKIKRDTLFIIGCLLLFIQFWTNSLFIINEYIFYIPAFMCIILSINFKKLNQKEIITIIALNILGLIIYIFSKSMNILKITLILSAAKNKDIDKLIKWYFYFGVIILLIHIFCSAVLNMGTLYEQGDFGRGVVEKRYYFGFSHANNLQLLFDVILILWLYTYFMSIKNQKKKMLYIFVALILVLIGYTLTKSRTGLIIAVIAIILSIVYSQNNYKLFIKNYRNIQIFYILIIISIIIMVFFFNGTTIFNYANKLMTGRLEFANRVLQRYNLLTLFGQQISSAFDTGFGYNIYITVDQGIISPLLPYGIIINILFHIAQLKLIKKYCLSYNYKRIMIILAMLFYSITENILFYAFTNVGIFFIADLIFDNRRTKNGRKNRNTNTNV